VSRAAGIKKLHLMKGTARTVHDVVTYSFIYNSCILGLELDICGALYAFLQTIQMQEIMGSSFHSVDVIWLVIQVNYLHSLGAVD
jgi:hypothetical protein